MTKGSVMGHLSQPLQQVVYHLGTVELVKHLMATLRI